LLKKYWDLEGTRKLPKLLVGVFGTLTFILIGLALYIACHTKLFFGEQSEPFFWHEGISIWSSELIRLLAGILGCLFIANTITVVAQNNRQLTTDFDLTASSQGNVAALWQAHCASRQWYFFWGTFGVICVLFWSVVIIKWPDFFLPSVPYRGEISYYANNVVLCFSVPVFIILLTLVLVTTWHDIRFFIKLDKSYSVWPQTTLRRFGLRAWGAQSAANNELRVLRETLEAQNDYHLDEWLDIKFIVARSKVIGQLLYYPFIILALMIFSHSKIFDNWDIPTGLIIGFLSVAIPTFICAFYLRRVAEHARKNSIEKISSMKIALSYQSDNDGRKAMEKQIDMALADIQAINTGAFQPLTSDPAFQALLIPFGGVGGVMLLENFVLNGF
jgi:hypothetical protein